MARVGWFLLGGWLALDAWLLATQGAARWRQNAQVAAAGSLGGRYAAILARPELGPAFDELLAEIEALRARGVERILLVTPPAFGLFVPTARHHAFPAQIVEQTTDERGAEALARAGGELGAGAALWYRPARGWQTLAVESRP